MPFDDDIPPAPQRRRPPGLWWAELEPGCDPVVVEIDEDGDIWTIGTNAPITGLPIRLLERLARPSVKPRSK